VEVASIKKTEKLKFKYLPAFAEYIKEQRLIDFIKIQLRYSKELKLPLLRFFEKMTEEQMIEISTPTTTEFLNSLINNTTKQHIEESQKRWLANQLPLIDKFEVVAEDITTVSYIKKKAFLTLLPEYTSILADAIAIITEIDLYNLEADTVSSTTYMNLLKEKIQEHSHFIERITETSPGIIYVFDLLDEKEVYANKMMSQLLGYEPEDWKTLDADFVAQLIHPDDIMVIEENQKAFANTADGEIRSIKYRIKDKAGNYRWMRTYESVFKRTADGTAWQVIGIALDIDKEKKTEDELQKREDQLLEAQELAEMGSFIWNATTGEREASPQFYKIVEMEGAFLQEEFLKRVHPGDRIKVKTALDATSIDRMPLDIEFRYHASSKEKILWIKGASTGDVRKDNIVKATVMDVTERHHIIQKLQRSEDINKKAQALTHIGNWTYDLIKNKVKWSEELYRIYELDTTEVIDPDEIRKLIHPDDIGRVIKVAEESRKALRPYDFYYRIITKSGKIKALHAIGEVLADENNQPYKTIGTLQDVTESETLITKLKEGEILYKQAQSLSHIGNWKWNINTGELEWSDEMYRLYGLEPQSENITLDRFKNFVHPDDKQYIEETLSSEPKERYDDIFKIITDKGEVKIIHSVAEMRFDESGKPSYIIGTEQDVTENERLIEEIQTSRELYKQSLEISKVGNWQWDVKKNIVTWDEQTFRNWELDPNETIELNLDFYLDHIPEDEREKVKEVIYNCYNNQVPYNITHRLVLRNGKIKYLEAKGHIVMDSNGEVAMMVGTGQDVTERETLIDRLQRSDVLYKQAQSIAHLGNWIYDVNSNKIYWTDELYRIYGIVPQSEELDWNKVLEYVIDEDKEIVNAFIIETSKSAKPFEMYHRISRKGDGEVRTVNIKGEALVDDGGNVYQLFGTTQDVTEQQRIEQELRDNQNFIKKIADATPSIIASYNINTGKYRFISHGLKTLLGYEPQEVFDKGVEFFANIMHPDDIGSVMEKNSKALELANSPDNDDTDMIVDFQYRMRKIDGEYRWFHTFGTIFDRNAKGKVEHILNISIDITDRIKAEETVAEQQRFISHIAEASPTILYLFDLEKNRFLYLNKEVTEVLGYTPEEIIGLGDKVYMYLHPEDTVKSPETYVKYKHAAGSASMHQFEGRIKNKQNEWKWLLTREVVFKRNEEGKAIQVLGSALDITDRKQMEQSISQKNLELEQSNANLEEFAYVASHDLQEPLRKISIFGDRLSLNHSDRMNDDGKLFLEKIVESSRRMQGMINDLLSVSLISGDKSFQPYSLRSILNEVLQTLEVKIEAKKATITSDDLPTATIIPSQIRQLFQNLISNSLKFVVEDKVPEIKISHSILNYSQVFEYNLPTGKQYIKININDNGIGFEKEFASKIFTIFQRLHGKSEYEGTGIGLAICKKIVENHEGVIFAEGRPGNGSTFTIIIPQ
jgi:PAS domain S-box-containing protein